MRNALDIFYITTESGVMMSHEVAKSSHTYAKFAFQRTKRSVGKNQSSEPVFRNQLMFGFLTQRLL